jgi:hypothetical protein
MVDLMAPQGSGQTLPEALLPPSDPGDL